MFSNLSEKSNAPSQNNLIKQVLRPLPLWGHFHFEAKINPNLRPFELVNDNKWISFEATNEELSIYFKRISPIFFQPFYHLVEKKEFVFRIWFIICSFFSNMRNIHVCLTLYCHQEFAWRTYYESFRIMIQVILNYIAHSVLIFRDIFEKMISSGMTNKIKARGLD
jgi:hypothetical protein